MRALAGFHAELSAEEAAARVGEWFAWGLVAFTVWAPTAPWHGSTLTYRRGTDWRSAYVRCLRAWLADGVR